MTMKRLRKLAARLPATVIRAGAHTTIALGAGTMCALGGANPESWWFSVGLAVTVVSIQWAWQSGRDAGRAEAYGHVMTTAIDGGEIQFSLTPSREQREWAAAALAATAALRDVARDHTPAAGKMEAPR